ncbi:sex hormone-binding globulin-like [Engraulis encrasicolus]|uniref:sex hormone-binding globulin-like n=1 Tax=Engraulis encrasicolus TaxID=184585 RepID=UPI002FD4B5FB
MNITANFGEVDSIMSYFSFRTFDPEGVFFYGHSSEGEDWFMLSLRGGVPEMQFGQSKMKVTATGGPKLNDGVWHKLEIYSEEEFVRLKVDGKPELRLRMFHDQPDPGMVGALHLALGGILIDPDRLPIKINPMMDACIRHGRWLSLITQWDMTPKKKEIPCFSDIKPGSFFSGGGLVIFNTSALPDFDSDQKMVISVHPSSYKWSGTILSMWSPHTHSRLISVGADAEAQKLFYRVHSGANATEDYFDKDIKSFQLTIEKDSITFEAHQQSGIILQSKTILASGCSHGIVEQWEEGMLLGFGGLLGEGGEYDAPDSAYMEGCLDSIYIQGQKWDLDQSLFKDETVSTHSCPF